MDTLCIVLHTHLPYVRRNGVWPCGEDFFHQAAAECYLPLLETLERLADRGLSGFLTLGMTPLVAHQMEDQHMLDELELYLGRDELRAMRQVANYRGISTPEVHDLAAWYALRSRRQLARLEAARRKPPPAGGARPGLAAAFGDLERAGAVELLGGPASHPLLPRIQQPAVLRAQLGVGVDDHIRTFGRAPRGMWLPECAWAPGRGIEDAVQRAGFGHVVVHGPNVAAAGRHRPGTIGTSRVVAFPRDDEVSRRVWSPRGGYPSGAWYRDFHHYDMEAGFKNWRITSHTAPLGSKRPYDPGRAAAHALADADRFVASLERALDRRPPAHDGRRLVVACWDTELFGHWWLEGPAWLEAVIERLSHHPRVRPLTLEVALDEIPAGGVAPLRPGSWGTGNDERSWVSPATEDFWPRLAAAEKETLRLASSQPAGPALDQLVRELFLLQSSDWPYMVARDDNAGYARERFAEHHRRWERLAASIRGESPETPARVAEELFDVDNVFPSLRADALTG